MAYDTSNCGKCYATHEVNGWAFEAKTYDPSERAEVMRDLFSTTKLLSANLGPENVPGGTFPIQMVTYHEDVKDRKMVGVTQFKPRFKSPANSSASGGNCGFLPGDTQNTSVNRTLVVQGMRADVEICADEFISTYYVKMLPRGANKSEPPIQVNDALMASINNEVALLVDSHAFAGDYKSNNRQTEHTDGFIKIAYQAIAAGVAPVLRWTFGGGLTNASRVAVSVGATIKYYAFDTDLATTLGNIATDLNTTNPPLNQMTQRNIFASVVAAATTLTFTGNDVGVTPDVQVIVLGASETAVFCDVTLSGTPAVSTEVATPSVVTLAAGSRQPISIAVVACTTETHAWDQVNALRDAILAKNPALLNAPGAYMVVASNVFGLLQKKYANASFTANGGVNAVGEVVTVPGTGMQYMNGPYGFPIINGNGMIPIDGLYFSHPANLHMGTDLLIDQTTITTGYDPKCGDFFMKNVFVQGYQIAKLDEFAGTLTQGSGAYSNYHSYQAAQPSQRVLQ